MIKELRLLWAMRKITKAIEDGRKGMKNWKTSLFGALALFVQAGKQLAPAEFHGILDSLSGVFTALGLFFAKDAANKG